MVGHRAESTNSRTKSTDMREQTSRRNLDTTEQVSLVLCSPFPVVSPHDGIRKTAWKQWSVSHITASVDTYVDP
jgi:hypothetical protein